MSRKKEKLKRRKSGKKRKQKKKKRRKIDGNIRKILVGESENERN